MINVAAPPVLLLRLQLPRHRRVKAAGEAAGRARGGTGGGPPDAAAVAAGAAGRGRAGGGGELQGIEIERKCGAGSAVVALAALV